MPQWPRRWGVRRGRAPQHTMSRSSPAHCSPHYGQPPDMLPHFFHLIGSDRFLTPTEVEQAAEPHPLTASAWELYASHFQGFTGATLDPLFHRLVHPATRMGSVRLDPGTAVLVIGTGPSLLAGIDAVKEMRG